MSANPPPPRNRSASGVGGPFVVLLILGVAIGVALGEPTIGFLGGLAAGVLAGLLLYLRDRRG